VRVDSSGSLVQVTALPADVQVGDVFRVKGNARVVGVREEVIDVSTLSKTVFMPGEAKATLLVTVSYDPSG